MAGQDVFKGALGWDDWIWWSGLGGLGLLLLMLVLCCVVCVQRAKRKGRAEALAAVQARERERQTQEQAQLRYAQAQQARYPAREASFKFSKPEPPQPTYNPYGHDDHAMRRNSYSSNAPVPKPKSSRNFQQPPGQQPMQQPPQQDPYHQQQQQQQPNRNDQPQQHYGAQPAQNYGGQQQAYGGQQYYSMPRREPQQQQHHQPQQQQYGYNVASPPPPRREFEELPQVAAYYGRKPQPQAEPTPSPQLRNSGPVMSQQYQRQQQINPNQPMIAQYRKVSGRSDVTPGGSFVYDAPAVHETPFVQVTTPRGSAASTASTNYSTAAPSTMPPPVAQGLNDRSSVASSSTSSIMKTGGTLRDRIDALRDSSAVLPATDSYARISVGSAASLNGSQVSYTSQHQQQQQPPAKAPLPPRRLEVVSGTVLSDASSTENEFVGTRYDNAFDEDAYATARSTHGMRRADSDLSIGVDDEPSRPSIPRDPKRRGGQRGRTTTGDSTGSIEF